MQHTCPSSAGLVGTQLIGIVDRSGSVAYIKPSLPVDEDFRAAQLPLGPLERRFRFSFICLEGNCPQWTGSRCGVIDDTLGELASLPLPDSVGKCSIRATCRWFSQAGWDACRVCSRLVTDLTLDPVP